MSRVHPWASPLRAFEHCVRRTAPLEYGSAVRSTILHRHFATYTILPLHLAPLDSRHTLTHSQCTSKSRSLCRRVLQYITNRYRTAYAATCHVVRPHAGMAETLKLPQSGPSSWSSHLEPDSRRGPELAPPYTVHTAHPCGQYGSQGRPRGVTTGVRACGFRTGYNAVRRRAQGGGEGPKGPPRSNPGGAQIEVSHHFRIWAVAHHTLAVACMELLKLSSCASMATTEDDSAVPLGCGLTEGVPQHTAHGTRHTAHGTRVQLAESPDPAMFSA